MQRTRHTFEMQVKVIMFALELLISYAYASLLVSWGFFCLCIITVPQKGEVGSGAAGYYRSAYWFCLVGVATVLLKTTSSAGCPA